MSIFSRKPSLPVLIKGLQPPSDNYKIKVRVLRVWDGFKGKGGSSLEMVLLDQEGDRIHATVEKDHVKVFAKELKEGQGVFIDTFKLAEIQGDYRTCQSRFKIIFYSTTRVTKCLDFPSTIPERFYVGFQEILSDDFDRRYLVDTIGQIIYVGHVEETKTQGKARSRLKFGLRDTEGRQLECVFWGDYAKQVSEYVKHNPASVVVCVIMFASVREYRGDINITNSLDTTRILLNSKSLYAKEFVAKLPVDKIQLFPSDDGRSIVSEDSLYDEFLGFKYMRVSINGLHDCNKPGKFLTLTTVTSLGNNNNWYYIGCKKCNRKVSPYPDKFDDLDQPVWKCLHCKKNVTNVIASYFIVLEVYDAYGGWASFLVFDPLGKKFIGKTAEELYDEAVEDGVSALRPSLAGLIDKEMLFKVTVSEANVNKIKSSFVVDLISRDGDIIDKFRDEISSQAPIIVEEDVGSGGDSDFAGDCSPESKRQRTEHDDGVVTSEGTPTKPNAV